MIILETLNEFSEDIISIRRDIHKHPELGFEEVRTSRLVATELEKYGLEVVEGIGKTGVVGTLSNGASERTIAIRADMDALPINELSGHSYRSTIENKMHACGHDGHTAMLLGAVRYLASSKNFNGTVHFIFQPAEEGLGGAKAMLDDGLFKRFPVSSVYAMHNMPGIPVGKFSVCSGPIMAGADNIDIRIIGKGGHAALPHTTIDPIILQAQIINALQSIISRTVDPIKNAVVSITGVEGGDAYNVIPDEVNLRGSMRYFEAGVRLLVQQSIEKIISGLCKAAGAEHHCRFTKIFEPTINVQANVDIAVNAATRVAGAFNVNANAIPLMGSEDFGFMLKEVPGCYLFIGNGDGENHCMIHNPRYDFNDEILVTGAAFWVSLVEQELSC